MKKTIYIYIGPSGAGKSTLSEVMKYELKIPELISTTTRKIRPGEVHGLNYYFVSDEEFDNTEMLEKSPYSGFKYGLSKAELENKLNDNDIVFAVLDKNGTERIKELYSNVAKIIVIYCYCSSKTVYDRLIKRGMPLLDIEKRMNNLMATGELQNNDIADYVILTDKHNLENCKEQLRFIIKQNERGE